MKAVLLEEAMNEELVSLYRDIVEAQFYADQMGRNREYTRLYHDMEKVEAELKRRPGDQRRLLIRYFGDSNPQVRLMSAAATLAVAAREAREVLERLSASGEYPQAANAGMLIDV